MPSTDRINPKANEWMGEKAPAVSAKGKQRGTARPVRAMSAQIQRLAKRLGVDPDVLAKKMPDDTVRRTKYPVIERVNEDGTRTFLHDLQIAEGVKGEIRP